MHVKHLLWLKRLGKALELQKCAMLLVASVPSSWRACILGPCLGFPVPILPWVSFHWCHIFWLQMQLQASSWLWFCPHAGVAGYQDYLPKKLATELTFAPCPGGAKSYFPTLCCSHRFYFREAFPNLPDKANSLHLYDLVHLLIVILSQLSWYQCVIGLLGHTCSLPLPFCPAECLAYRWCQKNALNLFSLLYMHCTFLPWYLCSCCLPSQECILLPSSPSFSVSHTHMHMHTHVHFLGVSSTAVCLSCWDSDPYLLNRLCPTHSLAHTAGAYSVLVASMHSSHLLSWRWNGIYGVMWWVFLFLFSRWRTGGSHWRRNLPMVPGLVLASWVGGWGGEQIQWHTRQDRALVFKDLKVWLWKKQGSLASTHINARVTQTWLEPWTLVLPLLILGDLRDLPKLSKLQFFTYLKMGSKQPNVNSGCGMEHHIVRARTMPAADY